MSVSKWAYTPGVCDGKYCVGDCDFCRNEMDTDDLIVAYNKYRKADKHPLPYEIWLKYKILKRSKA